MDDTDEFDHFFILDEETDLLDSGDYHALAEEAIDAAVAKEASHSKIPGTAPGASAPFPVLPEEILRLEYDGQATPRRSLRRFEYDGGGPIVYGNLTVTIEFGEVDAAGVDLVPDDTRTAERDATGTLWSSRSDRSSSPGKMPTMDRPWPVRVLAA